MEQRRAVDGLFHGKFARPLNQARAERISPAIHRLDARIERHELVALSAR